MNALHMPLPPGCKPRQRGPILPPEPRGAGDSHPVQGGSGGTCDAALHPVQPHSQLCRTGTQELPNGVSFQLLTMGLAVPGRPSRGTVVCHV